METRTSKTIYSKDHIFIVERLKKARTEAGLDQERAGRLLGKSQSYISKIESGQRRIDIVQLKKFGQIYKKPLEYFLSR
jgi:transcriptional regulator with XRE-family HTH domain